jgi:hypothetical protein
MGPCQSVEARKSIEATKYVPPLVGAERNDKLTVTIPYDKQQTKQDLISPSEATAPLTPSSPMIGSSQLQVLTKENYNLENASSLVELKKSNYEKGPTEEVTPSEEVVRQEIEEKEDVKLFHSRVISPASNTIRSSSSSKKKGTQSVDNKLLSNFSKLKVQVELAERAEKYRKHQEKISDRISQVQEYKSLWREYQQIQEQVDSSSTNDSGENSISLQNTNTWYFDFQKILPKIPDASSTDAKGLMSDEILEVQKKFFKQKSRQRRRSQQQQEQPNPKEKEELPPTYHNLYYDQNANQDYGPLRLNMENPYLSDDETPKTRTTASPHKVSFDDLQPAWELDNDYGVPRRRIQPLMSGNSPESIMDYLERPIPMVDFNFLSSTGNEPLKISKSSSKSTDISCVLHQTDNTNETKEEQSQEKDRKTTGRRLDFCPESEDPSKTLTCTSANTATPKNIATPNSSSTPMTTMSNPFFDMSPEQFLMMSSHKTARSENSPEQEVTVSSNPFYDMSPEQFLMMSSHYQRDLSFTADDDPNSASSISVVRISLEDEDVDFSLIVPNEDEEAEPEKFTISYDDTILSTPRPSSTKESFVLDIHHEQPNEEEPQETYHEEEDEEDDATEYKWQDHMSDDDFWNIERTRLSIDKCDELASRVSHQMSLLLSKYKQDNHSVGQQTI